MNPGESEGREVAQSDLERLRDDLMRFRAERDWEQFHTPRNLAASVVIEAAELLENFQWQREDEGLPEARMAAVSQELADVFIYLVMLAGDLGIDLVQAACSKMEENARRFPVSEARGASVVQQAWDEGWTRVD